MHDSGIGDSRVAHTGLAMLSGREVGMKIWSNYFLTRQCIRQWPVKHVRSLEWTLVDFLSSPSTLRWDVTAQLPLTVHMFADRLSFPTLALKSHFFRDVDNSYNVYYFRQGKVFVAPCHPSKESGCHGKIWARAGRVSRGKGGTCKHCKADHSKNGAFIV